MHRLHKMAVSLIIVAYGCTEKPPMNPPVAPPPQPSDLTGDVVDLEDFEALQLYSSWYDKHFPGHPKKWDTQKLPDGAVSLQAAGPLEPLFNRSIIWARPTDQNRQANIGFFPVSVTTGCSSGCTPVEFHLAINQDGTVADILTTAEKPLRKIGHQPFDDADMAKLRKVVTDMPKILSGVRKAVSLADNHGPFPPQTWNVFADVTVRGGAYTTFVVFDAASKLSSFLSGGPDQGAASYQNYQKLISTLKGMGQCESLDEVKACLAKIGSFSSPDVQLDDHGVALTRDALFSLLERFALRLDPSQPDDMASFANVITKHRDVFLVSQRNEFYSRLLVLATAQETDAFFQKLIRNPIWQEIDSQYRTRLELANALTQERWSKAVELADRCNLDEILGYFDASPDLQRGLALALTKAGNHDQALEALGHYRVQFPNGRWDDQFPWRESSPKVQASIAQAKKAHINKLTRSMMVSGKPLPTITATNIVGERVSLTSTSESSKRVYIFFASWCGHCAESIKGIIAQPDSKAILDQIQLVEVFIHDPDQFQHFAKYVGLPEAAPEWHQTILRLPDSPEVRSFYETMNLFATPKIVITNAKGDIIEFDYYFNHRDINSLRDLGWVLEATKSMVTSDSPQSEAGFLPLSSL